MSEEESKKKDSWKSKLLNKLLNWSIPLIIGGGITLVVAVLIGIIQDKKPDFYFIKSTPLEHTSSEGNYIFGSIELGNDGTKGAKEWIAEIEFKIKQGLAA